MWVGSVTQTQTYSAPRGLSAQFRLKRHTIADPHSGHVVMRSTVEAAG